jgi:hypothetical protein
MQVERGLTWTPKKRQSSLEQSASAANSQGLKSDFSSFSEETVVVINQFQENALTRQQLLLEQELVALVQEQLFLFQLQNNIVDNIRKNHYKNRNNNVVCFPCPDPPITANNCRTLLS